ncbi:MAG: 50S ribosomal protein L6 [Deltaproteobacteria bacterium ADurb.BinA179]|jgi:large subunit ribosomal protein L6|nr:50S ribosomal protein L6 [Deltaproteobacteria bacterium]MDI9541386.1 50S ribosomal protein L6 [Pseudomonadota bacterium]NLW67280.1 50S ribosomal protein L6 [Bacteriovoracaceae bacterium]OPZ28184.1 MAG: 50S ribosomal protein L6 [Deltaproteobacteria bacterium ADurb.BinA179]HRR22560.1 50S ribosomal protein L6 [Desulfomonilia bacterium]
MSRIGKMPIPIPKGVTVTITDGIIRVKGPKGELSRKLVGNIDVKIEDNTLHFTPRDEQTQTQAYHGLMRTLTNNMVVGVTEGFTKKLKIVGVGYRGEMKGSTLVLNVGYSKPVEYPLPKSVSGTVSKDGVIELSSIDKELVGDVAARIRKIRKPDSYQGKGIRYIDEVVRLKPGKSAAKA